MMNAILITFAVLCLVLALMLLRTKDKTGRATPKSKVKVSDAQAAQDLIKEAQVYSAYGRVGQALEIYDELITRFGRTSEPEIRKLMAKAKTEKEALSR